MKTKNETYFREQAKLPAPDGFVCIGRGIPDDPLENYFNCQEIFSENASEFFPNLNGDSIAWTYCVPVKVWEEKFGPFNKEINMSKNDAENRGSKGDLSPLLKIKFTPALVDLVCEIMQGKMGDCRAKHFQFDYLYLDGGGVSRASNDFLKEYTEVSASEFIAALEKLPDKQKEIIINLLPWTVTIRGERVDIGCQKGLELKEFLTFLYNAPSSFGNSVLFGKQVTFGKNGVWYNSQHLISWEIFNKLAEELKKLKLIP